MTNTGYARRRRKSPVVGVNAISTTLLGGGTVGYHNAFASKASSAARTSQETVMERGGTLRNLRIFVSANTGATTGAVITVLINNGATTFSITVPIDGSTGWMSDTTHTATFAAGDLVTIQSTTAASGNVTIQQFQIEVD